MQIDPYYSNYHVVQGSSFWQYRAYAGIRQGFSRKETSNDSGVARHAHVLRSYAEV